MGMLSINFDFGTKLLNKSNPTKAPNKKAPKSAGARPSTFKQKTASQPVLKGGVGYRTYDGDALWLPNTTRPDWLDGSLPGDRGFYPLGLSKPVEYLQFDSINLIKIRPSIKLVESLAHLSPLSMK